MTNPETESAFRAAFPGDERKLVFGEGPDNAPLLLIGEAPGKQEVQQGRPFVGAAGKNLDAFLQMIGLPRKGIRITNTVKVRPTRVSPKGTEANRPPNRQELEFFVPVLREEIVGAAPRLLVTLGNTPLQALLGKNALIGALHGTLTEAAVNGVRFRLFPLYHPAAIIYNRSLQAVYEADVRALAGLLAEENEWQT